MQTLQSFYPETFEKYYPLDALTSDACITVITYAATCAVNAYLFTVDPVYTTGYLLAATLTHTFAFDILGKDYRTLIDYTAAILPFTAILILTGSVSTTLTIAVTTGVITSIYTKIIKQLI